MKRSVALLETYKLHAELAERAAALREEFTKLYTGAVSAIVAAGVLLQRFASDKATELEWVLPVLGAAVSLSWLLSFWSTTARLGAKFHRCTRWRARLGVPEWSRLPIQRPRCRSPTTMRSSRS